MASIELIGVVIGFLLTCIVLSYIFGDNALFRFATHLFVGVSAGYAGAVALRNVIVPNVILPVWDLAVNEFSLQRLLGAAPFGLSVLLLAKLSARLGRLGNASMAFLVGVGAAVAIAGVTLGTLIPQTQAAIAAFDASALFGAEPLTALSELISRGFLIAGTLTTLIYFHFNTRKPAGATSQRGQVIESIASAGQIFIAVTFGALFAGVYTATLTALIERINALIEAVFLISGFFGF